MMISMTFGLTSLGILMTAFIGAVAVEMLKIKYEESKERELN